MAVTSLAAILAAWAEVLEASPLSLQATAVAFTHDLQPNATLPESYYVTDDGRVDSRSITGGQEVRIDRLTVWLTKPLNFAGASQLQTLETLLDDIYRRLIVRARDDGYNIEQDTRRVTHPPKTELIVASTSFRVDYDFNATPEE